MVAPFDGYDFQEANCVKGKCFNAGEVSFVVKDTAKGKKKLTLPGCERLRWILYGAADTGGNGSDRKTDVASITLVADGKNCPQSQIWVSEKERTQLRQVCWKILTTMSGVMDFWITAYGGNYPLDAVRLYAGSGAQDGQDTYRCCHLNYKLKTTGSEMDGSGKCKSGQYRFFSL